MIREIEERDNPQVEVLIRTCLKEFGGDRPGTAWFDPNLNRFSHLYGVPGARYWVAEESSVIVGGCGIGPMEGHPGICELQKMYCLPKARGTGVAKELLERSLAYAQKHYQQCYLETFGNMTAAQRFYEKNGFVRLEAPLPGTGHFGCDVWYVRPLIDLGWQEEQEEQDAGIPV